MQSTTFNRCAVLAVFAGVLAFGQRMYAEVVYTPVNISAVGNGILNIDLNHDGVTDVSIVFSGRSILCAGGGLGGAGSVYDLPASGNGVVANGSYVLALSSNATIGPSRSFYSAEGLMLSYNTCLWPPHVNSGAWQNVSNGYLGIRFQINGQTHYGWARLSVFGGRYGPTITLTGYAYESVAGTALLAGQTTGP